MSGEREQHRDIDIEQEPDEELLRGLFEGICRRTTESFLEEGGHAPIFIILTRLGLALIPADWDPDIDREAMARSIGRMIRSTTIRGGDEPVYDKPIAVILASEAWMVEMDLEENRRYPDGYVPPRLDPRRREILQVTLRSKAVSFSKNWSILRDGDSVTLGPVQDVGDGMESVWDIILTG